MYCHNCGHFLANDSQYCHICGMKQTNVSSNQASSQNVSSKCPACGAFLVSSEKGLSCLYCGFHLNHTESDAVLIEKLRIQEARDKRAYEEQKMLRKDEQAKRAQYAANQKIEKTQKTASKNAYKKEKMRFLAIIITSYALLLIVTKTYSGNPIWLLLQLVCFVLYFLTGNQVIPIKNAIIRKLFAYLGFVLVIPVIANQ